MERKVNTVIGIAIQNNSGGYFLENEEVQCYVAVEGLDKQHVNNKFHEIVRHYSSFCPCCGERWNGIYLNEWPAPDKGLSLENFKEPKDDNEINCILHLIDGTRKKCVYIDD